MKFKLRAVFFILTALSFVSNATCEPTTQETIVYYVTPNGSCPGNDTIVCHTLDDYARNSTKFFDHKENIQVLLLNGTHNLTVRLSLYNMSNLTMSVDNFTSLDPAMSPATIRCAHSDCKTIGISMEVSHVGVHIKNVKFENIPLNFDSNSQSDPVSTVNIILTAVVINGSETTGLLVTGIVGTKVNIQNSIISSNFEGALTVKAVTPTMENSELVVVVMQDCLISDNQNTHLNNPTTEFAFSNVTVENTDFVNNSGTGVRAYNSYIYFKGNVKFEENSAYHGGAIGLYQSYIFVTNGTTLTFINNNASDVGGAIFTLEESQTYDHSLVQMDDGSFETRCFLQFSERVDNESSKITFINNTAGRTGDHIYGSSLYSNCSLRKDTRMNVAIESDPGIFTFIPNLTKSHSAVSSDPKRICFCKDTNTIDCDEIYQTIDYFPGENFSINAVVVGNDFGMNEGHVHALCEDSDAVSANTQYIRYCTKLNYTVKSNEGNEVIALVPFVYNNPIGSYFEIPNLTDDIQLYKQHHLITKQFLNTPIFLNITLNICPDGFSLNTTTTKVCDCNLCKQGTGSNVTCELGNGTGKICRESNVWVIICADKTFVQSNCPYNYCRSESVCVDSNNTDEQCNNNRSGVLCGKCLEDFSLAIGSSNCIANEDNITLLLLVFFVFAGLILVLFIKLLDLTVARGSINGFVFYANIVWYSGQKLVPLEADCSIIVFLKAFIAWVNLDFGIEMHFFIGLDAYGKAWLQYIFPFYIWFLAAVIVIACHFSPRFTRLFGANATHVLATIFFLSYSKLLCTAISAFDVTPLQYNVLDCSQSCEDYQNSVWVWKVDPNLYLLSLEYVGLFAFSLFVFVFLWLPYTLLLLLNPCIQRVDRYRPLRWTRRLKPFLDTYFGPFKHHHTYWVGVLLLFRAVYLVLLKTLPDSVSDRAFLAAIAIAVAALLSIRSEGVYRKWYLTLLENSFLLNLIVVSVASIAFPRKECKSILFILSTGVAFVQFWVIVLVHFILELKRLKVCLWIETNCIRRRARRDYSDIDTTPTEHTELRPNPVVTNTSVYMDKTTTLSRSL